MFSRRIEFGDESSEDEASDSMEGKDIPDEVRELEGRKMAHNALFGFIPWISSVTKRPLETRSKSVRQLYEETPKNCDLWRISKFSS